MNSALIPTAAVVPAQDDIIALMMSDRRSENTRRTYRKALVDFFGGDPTPDTVRAFLDLDAAAMAYRLTEYKAGLLKCGLSESTINNRLAAVKALVHFARKLGWCSVDPGGLVDGERVRSYRDTSGVGVESIRKMLKQPDSKTLKGKRDRAILMLLWENGLRRSELVKLDLSDFHQSTKQLYIRGKGRGTQKEPISISKRLTTAILEYLAAADRLQDNRGPLFSTCNRRANSHERLTTDGVYYIVNYYAEKAEISKRLSPHRIRHSAITAALDASKGNVRAVQRFSRHSKIETLMIYDDNRRNFQGDISNLLSDMVA